MYTLKSGLTADSAALVPKCRMDTVRTIQTSLNGAEVSWVGTVSGPKCLYTFSTSRRPGLHFQQFAVARPSVCLSSVTFVCPTQAVQIFGNISMALGTLAIC